MNRILIIGSCGAGKSTIAKRINEKINLPLINLDKFYWKPNWVRSSKEESKNKVKELVKGDKWIMEGNYQSTFDIRFPASDTIIFLDINRFVCLWRILKRWFSKNRVDKIHGCDEKMDFQLIKWVLWDYPKRGRKKIIEAVEKYNKRTIVIKSNKDFKNIDDYIKKLKHKS